MNAITPLFQSAHQPIYNAEGPVRFAPQTLLFMAPGLPSRGSHVLPLTLDANLKPGAVMNAVAAWLNDQNVFDQRDVHGGNWSQYRITAHCLYNKPSTHRPIVADIFLADHVFANCKGYAPGDFDEFMRILDRHKIADELHRRLQYYKDYEPQGDVPRLWLDGFRTCCHPDHRRAESTGGGWHWPQKIAAAPA